MSRLRTIAGVEIARDEVRVVVLQRGVARTRVASAEAFRYSNDPRQVAGALKSILKRTRGRKEVRFAVALPSACVRVLDLPAVDRATLAQIVPFELQRHIPFSESEVCFDYCVLGMTSEGLQRVLVAAVKRDEFEAVREVMERVAGQSAVCTLSNLAEVAIASPRTSAESQRMATIVVDLSENHTTNEGATASVTIWDGANNLVARSVHWRDLLHLAAEIRRTAAGFRASANGSRIERCRVCGDGARELIAALDAGERYSCEEIDVWHGMEPPPIMPANASKFFAATAVALQAEGERLPVNLLRSHRTRQRSRRKSASGLVIFLVALTLLMAGGYHSLRKDVAFREKQVTELETRIHQLRASLGQRNLGGDKSVGPDVAQIEALATDARRSSFTWLEVLRKLSKQVPATVWLKELVCQKDKDVMISGTAATNADVAATLKALETTGLFSDVKLIYSRVTHAGDHERFQFQMSCSLQGLAQ